MIRTPEAFIPYVLAFATLLAGLLWHFGDAAGQLGYTVTYGQADIGGPYTLIDQNGAVRSNKDFHGTWTLIYFGYTHCPDVCPTTLAQISDVLRKLPGKPVKALFITVDPDRDSAKTMGDYVSSFDPRVIGLSGTPAEIGKTEKEFRVYSKKAPEKNGDYSMDHSSVVYLIDRNGQFAEAFNLERSPDESAKELATYL